MSDIREDLKAYLDGELEESRALEVRAAIDADASLQQEVEFMKMLGFEIKRLAAEPQVQGRAEAIARVRRSDGVWWLPSRWPFAAQAAAVIVLVCLAVPYFWPVYAQRPNAAVSAWRGSEGAAAGEDAAMPAESAKSESEFPIGSDAPASAPAFEGPVARGGAGGKFDQGIRGREEVANKRSVTTLPSTEGKGGGSVDKPATSVPMAGGNRLVVKNADMGIRVEDVGAAMSRAGSIAESLGGFVISSQAANLKDVRPTGFVTLRVPATRFDPAMKQLRALGDVVSESSSGEDVTAQVADLDARTKVLRAEEDSYITMLRAARRVNEMLEIKERLSRVRQEIEGNTAQLKSLKDLATLSTITCSFEQKVKLGEDEPRPTGSLEETWNSAVNGLKRTLEFLGQALIVVFVYSPIWLPIVGLMWWASRRLKR